MSILTKDKMMSFSTRLKELRKERGLTQTQLAILLKIDSSTIAKYETGDRLPDAYMLITLADFFDTSVDYLLGRADC